MSNKLVSVVIPCYNCESTIEETIQSVLSQSYKNIEIICINDGSTDGTSSKLEKITSFNNNIVCISQENQGQTKSRNTGAKKAKGIYLLFLDSDDRIDSTFIEKSINILESNPTIQIVYSLANFFGDTNEQWKLPEYEFKSFLINNCIPITALIRMEEFNKAGGFDESITFYEDWELWLKIILNGGEVYRIPEVLFFYRKHSKETSLTDNAIKDNYIFSINKLKIYHKHYNVYHKHIGSFENLVYDAIIYKKKYYNQWFKKIFYKFKKPLK